MSSTLFPATMALTGLIVATTTILSSTSVQAQARVYREAMPPSQGLMTLRRSPSLAQAGPRYAPVGCRITRDQIGVYQEPNLSEAALAVLAKEVTITLGTGSGNGWARIVAPQTGWVQAKFLRGGGSTPCPTGQEPGEPGSPTGIATDIATPAPASAPVTGGAETDGGMSRAVCAVLPEGGLIVRDRPNLSESRVIGSIRPGNYTFQFTGRRTEADDESQRQWAYITAPAKGWISTGLVGGGGNLAGKGCS